MMNSNSNELDPNQLAGAEDDDNDDEDGDGIEGEGNDARHGAKYRGEGVGEDGVDGMMGGSDEEEEEVDAV